METDVTNKLKALSHASGTVYMYVSEDVATYM